MTKKLTIGSICFIHGLGGGRISTWSKGDVFWPYHLLAKDIPEARIMTWGYKADVAHFISPTSTNRVKDHAKSLSNALSALRNSPETSRRPIMFVAHSLGGLVCAQSLLESLFIDAAGVERLSDHTAALTFMGTPFEGSDTAKWSNLFKRLSQLLPIGEVNKNLLDYLRTDSHELKILGEDFPKWLNNRQTPGERRVQVICFFEELSTHGIGHIVPRESAQIAGHESLSLPDNHVGICKFDNFQDPKYKIVLSYLMKWVVEIREGSRVQNPQTVNIST
ncbi:MAG: hypothetical protein Q9171_002007 [Xanthocarpia ochracea]